MKLGTVAILLALAGGVGCAAPKVPAQAQSTKTAPSAPPSPAPLARVPYGAAPSQFVEVFLPPGPGPFPLAIFMHGGCYISSDANIAGMRRTYVELANRGVAVWGSSIGESMNPAAPTPECSRMWLRL